jgi:ribose 5-phosphate isomerase B
MKTIVLASDHGGVRLRDEIAHFVQSLGFVVEAKLGPASAEESCDYPDVALEACRMVLAASDRCGILVCGTGQGMAMSANKVVGIRAGVVGDPFSAQMIRAHNDANVMCLGERVLGAEIAKLLVRTFLSSEFEGGRHQRRVAKIDAICSGPSSTSL